MGVIAYVIRRWRNAKANVHIQYCIVQSIDDFMAPSLFGDISYVKWSFSVDGMALHKNALTAKRAFFKIIGEYSKNDVRRSLLSRAPWASFVNSIDNIAIRNSGNGSFLSHAETSIIRDGLCAIVDDVLTEYVDDELISVVRTADHDVHVHSSPPWHSGAEWPRARCVRLGNIRELGALMTQARAAFPK